jgi:hypothetical protein
MPLQPGRIVEIVAPAGSRRRGSGYLLDSRLVLTSGHVAPMAAHGEFRVRSPAGGHWAAATIAWRGDRCDAVLLRLREPAPGVVARVRLGRIEGFRAVSCEAVGLARAHERERVDRVVREPQHAGAICPITRASSRLLSITLTSGAPLKRPGGSPWAGASGAAVFSRGLLVGVLRGDSYGFVRERLDATPISEMVAEQGFRTLLGDDAWGLEAVEAQGLLERAYAAYELRAPSSGVAA